jgi:DNA modification methylase
MPPARKLLIDAEATTARAATVRPVLVLRAGELSPGRIALTDDLLIEADCADVLPRLPTGAFDVIYIDPPFNTGGTRRKRTLATVQDAKAGDRTGFGGHRYRSRLLGALAYEDRFADYLGFLEPRLLQARRLLAAHGTLSFHIDYREAHYCKLLLDELFDRDCFLNEIIWAYDYGAKPKRRWPAKHDTILVYVREAGRHWFDADAVEREPYMAPGLVGAEKAARGKRPCSVWWHTIVPTTGAEKTGYPTQKPEGIVRRMVAASSRPGGWCLDFFAGSGTLGAVCAKLDRRFVLVDSNPEAVEVAAWRLGAAPHPSSSAA